MKWSMQGSSGLVLREGATPDGTRYVVFDRPGRPSTLYGVESLTVAQDAPQRLEDQLRTPGPLAALAARPAFRPATDTPKHIIQLNVGNTHHCNLACTYCYNELPTQRPKETEAWMSEETARTMVDALLAQSGDAPTVSLVWIGGEALLQKKLIQDTVDYARAKAAPLGKDVGVVVYSNGVTLTPDVVQWANEKTVSLVVSVDGPPRVHDRDDARFRYGRGVACLLQGISNGAEGVDVVGASVQVSQDGSALVGLGLADMGQGARTVCAQIASEILGIPLASITIRPVDTTACTTRAPRSPPANTTVGGQAVKMAATEVRKSLVGMAAKMFKVDEALVDLRDGFAVLTVDANARIPLRRCDRRVLDRLIPS